MSIDEVFDKICLHYAVKCGNLNRVNDSLSYYRDIDLEDNIFKKPLQVNDKVGDSIFEESKFKNSKLLKVVNHYDVETKTPLLYATENEYYDIACKLILYGAKVDSIPKEHQAALLLHSSNLTHCAYSNEHEYRTVVGLLAIKVPEAVTDFSVNYMYPRLLSYYLHKGHMKVIDALLEAVGDRKIRTAILNSPNNSEYPLNCVNSIGINTFDDDDHLKCVRYLMENGATKTMNKQCPIEITMMAAASNGHIKTFKYFLNKANKKDFNTYIGLATRENKWSIIKFLWENYREYTTTPESHDTALHYAAWRGTLESVKYLCQNGATIHCKNNKGESPLDYAIERGDTAISSYLSSL